MKHRKCDTTKYRRRMAKQKLEKNQRKKERREQRQKEYAEAERALLRERHVRNIPQHITRDFLIRGQIQRLELVLLQRINSLSMPEAATPEEVTEMLAEAAGPPAPVICPLCKRPITLEEAAHKNVKKIIYNREPVQVHRVCPTEAR